MRAKPSLGRGVGWVVLVGFFLFFTSPIIWLVLAATKTQSTIVTEPPFSFGSFENVWTAWTNVLAFNQGAILHWFANSVIYSVGSVALAIVVTIPAGYALAVGSFAGRRLILTTTLVAMVMPSAALVLPIFLSSALLAWLAPSGL